MKKTTILLMALALALVAMPAMALTEVPVDLSMYATGSRAGDNSAQVTATGSWLTPGNFLVEWEITPVSGGFEYEYDITALGTGGGLSHFLLQTSLEDVFKFSGFSTDPVGGTYDGPEAWTEAQGNPSLPAAGIYGLKITPASTADGQFSFEFFSPNIPVWGDFYAKGGLTYAYNAGLGTQPVSDFQAWIPVPDSKAVPVPPSVLLLGSGFLGIGILRFRKSC